MLGLIAGRLHRRPSTDGLWILPCHGGSWQEGVGCSEPHNACQWQVVQVLVDACQWQVVMATVQVMAGQDYCPSHDWSRLLSKS
jgi:hypothetical protein